MKWRMTVSKKRCYGIEIIRVLGLMIYSVLWSAVRALEKWACIKSNDQYVCSSVYDEISLLDKPDYSAHNIWWYDDEMAGVIEWNEESGEA
jgi:hypothetical protein